MKIKIKQEDLKNRLEEEKICECKIINVNEYLKNVLKKVKTLNPIFCVKIWNKNIFKIKIVINEKK